MNEKLVEETLHALFSLGITEFCICPGGRNAPLVIAFEALLQNPSCPIRCYYWPEERSASYFALGKARATQKPIAIVTTSGTASGELLPAAMEAYYSGIPLLLITADRPRRFRHTGAPQTAEQVGLFGLYAKYAEDIAGLEKPSFKEWDFSGPAHLNICFEEPLKISPVRFQTYLPPQSNATQNKPFITPSNEAKAQLTSFLESANFPFVVVGAVEEADRENLIDFLQKLNAPTYLEGLSGLREDKRLEAIKITQSANLLKIAANHDYPIDCVLRIGGVPTFRTWRDLENAPGIKVSSLSPLPFSGLSDGALIHASINETLSHFTPSKAGMFHKAEKWQTADREIFARLQELLVAEPYAEASLIHQLSLTIPRGSLVYLGNSLPIREWDQAATMEPRGYQICASRGVNGIDGQISTFLGLCQKDRPNWAILGDLTALYDMTGPWILRQLADYDVTIVIVNNNGGQIFSRMYNEKAFLHEHQLNFEPLANMWGMEYRKLRKVPTVNLGSKSNHRLIELIPDLNSTIRFHEDYHGILTSLEASHGMASPSRINLSQ